MMLYSQDFRTQEAMRVAYAKRREATPVRRRRIAEASAIISLLAIVGLAYYLAGPVLPSILRDGATLSAPPAAAPVEPPPKKQEARRKR
jgi:hypothetical protein